MESVLFHQIMHLFQDIDVPSSLTFSSHHYADLISNDCNVWYTLKASITPSNKSAKPFLVFPLAGTSQTKGLPRASSWIPIVYFEGELVYSYTDEISSRLCLWHSTSESCYTVTSLSLCKWDGILMMVLCHLCFQLFSHSTVLAQAAGYVCVWFVTSIEEVTCQGSVV